MKILFDAELEFDPIYGGFRFLACVGWLRGPATKAYGRAVCTRNSMARLVGDSAVVNVI